MPGDTFSRSSDYSESDRGDAVEVLVTGRWSTGAAEAFTSGRARRLVLNHALGFDETDLDFLDGLPVRELVLIDRRVSSLAPVHELSSTLESVRLTTDPSLVLELDRLPLLRELSADWGQVSATIGSARGLHRVSLGRYSETDLSPLAGCPELGTITMKDRPRVRSLNGVETLPRLRRLALFGAGALDDLSGLAGRGALQELELEACPRIEALDDLVGCVGLTRLNLSDDGGLASLAPLAAMARLEVLRLFGTTTILDGDLTVLTRLPRLRDLRMRSRRGYEPSVTEVQANLGHPDPA